MTHEEAEVLRLEQDFLAAWNRGDARGASAPFADDGMRVGAFGDVARGRNEVEMAYEKLLHGPMKGARAEWAPAVRMLAPDLVVAEGALTIHPADGGKPARGYALDIWRKIAGTWRLIEAHPKLYPVPPA